MATPMSSSPVQMRHGVFLHIADGMAKLLDFERGRFYGLDPIATEMLSLAIEAGPRRMVETVAERYGEDPARVRGDARRLLSRLTGQHLVTPGVQRKPLANGLRRALRLPAHASGRTLGLLLRAGSPQAPARWRVVLILTITWFSLRTLGWTRTLKWFRCWHRQIRPLCGDASAQTISRVDQQVRTLSAKSVVLPMVCKERAVAAYQLLRVVHGLPAQIVVGIDTHPFRAHAWVEYGGQVLTDDAASCERFTPVARYR